MRPEPHFTLIKTSIGANPAIVVVNSSLRNYSERASFAWHLRITIDCKFVGANGMPTHDELKALDQLEEMFSSSLLTNENAMFLARITCKGTRDLCYRVRNPDSADEILGQFLSNETPLREWEYRMEEDVDWELADLSFNYFLLSRTTAINSFLYAQSELN